MIHYRRVIVNGKAYSLLRPERPQRQTYQVVASPEDGGESCELWIDVDMNLVDTVGSSFILDAAEVELGEAIAAREAAGDVDRMTTEEVITNLFELPSKLVRDLPPPTYTKVGKVERFARNWIDDRIREIQSVKPGDSTGVIMRSDIAAAMDEIINEEEEPSNDE